MTDYKAMEFSKYITIYTCPICCTSKCRTHNRKMQHFILILSLTDT